VKKKQLIKYLSKEVEQMDPAELWTAIKEQLRESMSGDFGYQTYVERLQVIDLVSNEFSAQTLHLSTDQEKVAEEWRNPEGHYYRTFIQAAMTATAQLYAQPIFISPSVMYVPAEAVKPLAETPVDTQMVGTEVTANFISTTLDPDFRFDTFVSSVENKEAYSVAQAVAENPGTQWNPLLIYGGVGLGKTHLMQSIGNEVLRKNPNAKVKFITTEDFINDFTDALRRGTMDEFKHEYRTTNLLMVDDVQFLADKTKIQEEFFNTFNAITRENNQIVLTSDKLPKEIPGLEMRLVTRFGQGYSANITKPDLPTRVAILRNKSEQDGLNIPNDIIDEIAAAVDTNVRDLESVFNQVAAKIKFSPQPVTVDATRNILEQMSFKRQKVVTVPIIQTIVSNYFDLTVDDLTGTRRNKQIVTPRQIAMYLARELTQDSLPQIGRAFGGRDHTTVMHSTEKIEGAIGEDHILEQQVQEIRERLSDNG
jgi:chromosomal replication initiator protein